MRVRLRNETEKTIEVPHAIELISKAKYISWYDTLPPGNTNELEVLDLAFPAFLGAVPNFKALLSEKTLQALRIASKALRELPSDVSLAGWPDTEQHREQLLGLFRATTGGGNRALSGFGPARCTKMLHKKRPALIPIIDSWQLQAWSKPAQSWRTDDMVEVVFNIQKLIISHADEFRELAEHLKSVGRPIPHLSAVRLYDILFWEHSNLIGA